MHEFEDDLVLTRAAVRQVDREAVDTYGIPGIVLMENAARGAAELALLIMGEHPPDATHTDLPLVTIVCGPGNNGGDGYAMARHLHNSGCEVLIIRLGEPDPDSDAGINRAICQKMNIKEVAAADRPKSPSGALVVDALFGTGIDRDIDGDAATLVKWINSATSAVLAIDIPSGLDADTGAVLGTAVRADVTVTFVAFKPGLLAEQAAEMVGDVFVVDISAPVELVKRLATGHAGDSAPAGDSR